jgi:hypothetical protein
VIRLASILLFVVFVVSSGALAAPRHGPEPSDSSGRAADQVSQSQEYPLGFSLNLEGGMPFHQTPDEGSGDYLVNIGIRYTLGPPVSLGMKFSTGRELHTQSGPGLPLAEGTHYAVGGASFGIETRALAGPGFQPALSAYYDFQTILSNSSGYDGNGVTLAAGCEYLEPGRFVSFRLALTYVHHNYTPYAGNPQPDPNPDSYTQNSLGILFSTLIHFHLGL